MVGVLFYHAGIMNPAWQLAPGGFLGVDVFFVISGYLITSIIRNELVRGSFSFSTFYQRRVRRIAPALLVVVLVSTPFAWKTMPADMFQQFAGSAFSALAMVGNVWFWLEDSYVSPNSALKPLLHLWSLGVEEQFYLLMPLCLVLLWRKTRHHLPIIVAATMVASFLLAQHAAVVNPDSAFFLLPFRAWELLLGAYIALVPQRQLCQLPAWIHRNASNLGLLAIIISFLGASHRMLHPGWVTLLPVVGSGLIIAFPHNDFAGRLLKIRVIVWIGLISYSLYLIHYPVMSLMRIAEGTHLPASQIILALGLSLLLATLNYRMVEQPLRNRTLKFHVVLAFVVGLAVATGLALTAVQLLGYRYHGENTKVQEMRKTLKRSEFIKLHQDSPVANPFLAKVMKKQSTCRYRHPQHACSFGDASWVSLGDSYAGQLDPVLHERFEAGGPGFVSLAYEQCPLLDRGFWFGDAAECPTVNELRWRRIEAFEQKKVIVYAANYGYFNVAKHRTTDPIGDGRSKRRDGSAVAKDEVIASHRRSIARLLELGHDVALVYSIPHPQSDVRLEYFRHLDVHGAGTFTLPARFTSNAASYEQSKEIDQWIDVPDHPQLVKIHPREIFCESAPPNRCLLWDEKGPIYNGGGHLSRQGARQLIGEIVKRIQH